MSRDPSGFGAWCETEFGWDEGDREEVPYDALVAYDDAALAGREPGLARHPDLGWMVVADQVRDPPYECAPGHRLVVWHEAHLLDLLAAARLWAD